MVYCPTCGSEIPEGMVFCGKCGEQIYFTQVAGFYAEINNVQMYSPYSFLNKWKTNLGFTVAGVILAMIINGFFSSDVLLSYTSLGSLMAPLAFGIVYIVIGIIYAAVIYPSLFTENPKAQSSEKISFINGLFGGLVFGLIWNSNLTNGKKGISHIVYIILIIATLIGSFIIAFLG